VRGECARRFRPLQTQYEESTRLVVSARASHVVAEVDRTSSGSEKRVVGIGRVESLSGVPNRVNGSLTIGALLRVSEGDRPAAKGGRFIRARRSSSRERRRKVNASRFRPFVLRRGRAGCVPRLATEGISGWWSARLSRGPRETDLGGLRSYARGSCQKRRPRKRARRRRQRCQRRTVDSLAWGEHPQRVASSESRSEKRSVKRASPRSRLHRRAPSLPVRGGARLRTRDAVTRKTFRVEEHGAARLWNESD